MHTVTHTHMVTHTYTHGHAHPAAQSGILSARYCNTAAVPWSRMGLRMVLSMFPSSIRERRVGLMRPSCGGRLTKSLLVRFKVSSLQGGCVGVK